MNNKYHFKQVAGDVITVADTNTIINYCNDRGGLRVLPTIRNRVVYRATAVGLNLVCIMRPVKGVVSLSLF